MKRITYKYCLSKLILLIVCIISIGKIKAQTNDFKLPDFPAELKIQAITVAFDSSRIVFATETPLGWKLYEMLKANNKWTVAAPIDAINAYIPENQQVKSPFLTYDGKYLYFAANIIEIPGGQGGLDIYFSELTNGKWSVPQNTGIMINTEVDEDAPSISPDGKQIYFTRPNADAEAKDFDCKTIYSAGKNNKGKWEFPLPLPDHISYDCEKTPYIAADGKTLYFSSVRTTLDNGFQLFVCRKINEQIWSQPVALDSVNTIINDISPCIAGENKIIWTGEMVEKKSTTFTNASATLKLENSPQNIVFLNGKFESEGKAPQAGRIVVHDASHSITIDTIEQSKTNTEYQIILPSGKLYNVFFTDENSTKQRISIDSRNTDKNITINKHIDLVKYVVFNVNVYEPGRYENIPANAKFNFEDAETGESLDIFIENNEIGVYAIHLPVGKTINMKVQKDNCQLYNETIDLKKNIFFNDYHKEIRLVPQSRDFEIVVSDFLSGQPVEATIIITNTISKEEHIRKVDTGSNLQAKVTLQNNNQYLIEVLPHKGYFFYSVIIDFNETEAALLDVKLRKIEPGLVLETFEVQFIAENNELTTNSFSYLNRLAELLTTHSNMKLGLSLSSDSNEKVENTKTLSQMRINAILNYMELKGVNKHQLKTNVLPPFNANQLGFNNINNAVKIKIEILSKE